MLLEKNCTENYFEEILNDTIIKLSDYSHIEKITNLPYNTVKLNGLNIKAFDKYSLSNGLPSLCVLFGELNELYPNKGYEKIAHNYLSTVVSHIRRNINNIDVSLWSGLCGIALSTVCMSNKGTNYQSLIKTLNKIIADKTIKKLNRLNRIDDIKEEHYDVMYGLSGVANYLMLFKDDSQILETLTMILTYMINICKYKVVDNKKVPRFMISKTNSYFVENNDNHHYINLGLSHGIPGILMVLIKAYSLGIILDGQLSTINMLKNLILNHCINTGYRKIWSSEISMIDYINERSELKYSRDAWCYGTPGIAYVLLVTAEVLKDDNLKNFAIESMKDALKYKLGINSPTFCHGYAGLLYLSHKFYEHTKIKYFKTVCENIQKKIITFYNKNNPFGFKNIEFCMDKPKAIDDPGLLNGTSGILLSMMATCKEEKTPWSLAFMLNN